MNLKDFGFTDIEIHKIRKVQSRPDRTGRYSQYPKVLKPYQVRSEDGETLVAFAFNSFMAQAMCFEVMDGPEYSLTVKKLPDAFMQYAQAEELANNCPHFVDWPVEERLVS